MNKNKKAQQGFTLIELVVVIVILGILAVTAAPKFIDLTGDARASVIEATEGSINSAADLAHAKALVSGQDGSTGAISVGTSTINLKYGWPQNASMADLLDLDGDITEVSGSDGTFTHIDAATEANCVAAYNQPTDAETRATISSTTTGC